MKRFPWLVLLVTAVVACGCAKKVKEITEIDRKQAANLASEAQFAATLRDYPRAEGLYAQAAALCPDTGAYWLSLGSMRVRQSHRDDARDAYQRALAAFRETAQKTKADSEPALQQLYVLALLGRVDEARSLQAKLPDQYPGDRDVRAFVDGKRLDQILADPTFKTLAVQ